MDRPANFPFESHFQLVSGTQIHYLDEGDTDNPPIIFLHGVPTWSYTFRNVIPGCVKAGLRVIAPDLPGFGLSEKYVNHHPSSLQWLVSILADFIAIQELKRPVLYAHDWGVLLGLLLASGPNDPFSGLILSNGFLPVPGMKAPWLFRIWRTFARYSPILPLGMIVNIASKRRLSREERKGYNLPFRSMADKRAVRIMPGLIPAGKKHIENERIIEAWMSLEQWDKPLLTLFGDGDPITRGVEKIIQERIPGADGMSHKIFNGGHFLQEDVPEEIAREIVQFMKIMK